MLNFTFKCPTKIIFGKGEEKNIGTYVSEYSKNILLVYGGGSIKKTGLYDTVVSSLNEAGVSFKELSGIQPNPRLSPVYEGIKICRENNIDFILAVGGGSVADTAKGIASGVPYDGDVWDFYCGKASPKTVMPLALVLTIPATGSEASNSSVITKEEGKEKRNLPSELIRPVFSVLNPELTYSLPPYQTACGAVDIMSHDMERYFTNVEHTDLTDRLCEAVLKTIIVNAPIALREPENYDARAEIMWAGTLAHNDLLGTGRQPDWTSHMVGHEMSALFDLAHGASLSIMHPAWMKYVYKYNVPRFSQFAKRVFDVPETFGTEEEIAVEGIRKLEEFFRSIGMPVRLSDAGIPAEAIPEMAARCTFNDTSKLGWGIHELGQKDIENILELAK